MEKSLVRHINTYLDSAIRARVLYAVVGLICAVLIGLAAPMPEAVTATSQTPEHVYGYVVDDDCSPSDCDEENPSHGHRFKCGGTCPETPGEICCSIPSDSGCIKCHVE